MELTEDQIYQLIDTIDNPSDMKKYIAIMFLKSLLEDE